MVILGTGVLMAWNSFISAFDYFSERFGNNIEFRISCAFNYPSLIMLFVSVRYAASWSVSTRIAATYSISLVMLVVTPCLSLLGLSYDVELWLTLFAVFITGVCTGVVFGTVLGFASLFPSSYITAAMSGIGLSGIVAAALRIVTKASLPNTEKGLRESTFIYFSLAGLVLAVCITLYFAMLRHPFVKYHIVAQSQPPALDATDVTTADSQALSPRSQLDVYSDGVIVCRTDPSVVEVFSKLWKEGLGVYIVFVVTLSMFPGVTSQIKPKDPNFLSSGWYQVLLTSEFMLFDYIGRTSPRFIRLFSPRTLLIPILCRLAFVPLFLLAAGTFTEPYFTSWAGYPFLFMAFFALSNGYCGTLAMMYGPDELEPYEKENGGIQMSFLLNAGVLSGVNIALAFTG